MFLSASVATLALIAAPSAAQKEERGINRDGQSVQVQRGGGGGEQRAQRTQRAERPQRAERQQVQRAERPQRVERPQRMERAQRVERPQRIERAQRVERSQRIERVQRAERPQRMERSQRIERAQRIERTQRAERPQRVEQARRIERQQVRELRGNDRRVERAAARIENRVDKREFQRDRAQRALRIDRDDRQLLRRAENRPLRRAFFATPQGKPHLLGVHDMGRHEGDFRRRSARDVIVGQRIDPNRFSSVIPTAYRTRYYDTNDWTYRYDDGYVYRIGRQDNILNALIPLGGSSYYVGDQWPSYYQSSYVPYAYSGMYYDTPYYDYRYADGGIYRVNTSTGLISAVMALLTGYNMGPGSYLPATYDVYNVPYGYRDYYRDSSDSWYRYNDGYIYDVDPRSRIIRSSYPIYDDNYAFGIGQPWPIAYPDYNVPYGYQDMYYDTPEWHYRYADGGIYQVDPQSRMIQALVALVTGDPFVVGQPMPVGYSTYNVPIDYRDRYYDTADANYRYSNGVVYRVDPITGLIERGYPIYA